MPSRKKQLFIVLLILALIFTAAIVIIGDTQPQLHSSRAVGNMNEHFLPRRVMKVDDREEPVLPAAQKQGADLHPFLGKSLSKEEIAAAVARKHPNFPTSFWESEKAEKDNAYNKNCAALPSVYDLKFNGIDWQVLETSSNGSYYLYSAFYDNRSLLEHKPVIRVLGMMSTAVLSTSLHCQMWFGNDSTAELVVAPVEEHNLIWLCKQWKACEPGQLLPYLLGCRIPNYSSIHHNQVPLAVSLVEKPCDNATYMLKVIHNVNDVTDGAKRDFAVCVKGASFFNHDISVRLVEWIEMLKILGADKIFMHEMTIHPNVTKVIRYYEQRDLIEVAPLTLPGGQPNVAGFMEDYLKTRGKDKAKQEVIPYNDCLYKNMYRYNYVVLVDTDEVIMPLVERSWKDLLLKRVINNNNQSLVAADLRESYATIHFRNLFFWGNGLLPSEHWFDDIPKYMHMLQHVNRTTNFSTSAISVKGFFNTERVLTVHNHFPFACLGKQPCRNHEVNTSFAYTAHYRHCTEQPKDHCDKRKADNFTEATIWRFKDELIEQTTKSLRELGFLQEP